MSTLALSVTNPALEKRAAQIREKKVPWENYEKADVISSDQVALLDKIGNPVNVPDDQVGDYAELTVVLLGNLSRNDHVQAILVFCSDFIIQDERRVQSFTKLGRRAYDAFIKFFDSPDPFIQQVSLAILGALLADDPNLGNVDNDNSTTQYYNQVIDKVLEKVLSNLNESESFDLAFQICDNILRSEPVRSKAIHENDGQFVKDLIKVGQEKTLDPELTSDYVANGSVPQRQYQIVFALWLLTFDKSFVKTAEERFGLLKFLQSVLGQSSKEKVIRIVTLTLLNYANASHQNTCTLVGYQIPKLVQNLVDRQWSDDDIKPDLEALNGLLQDARLSLTTFEEYLSELNSGTLDWSPIHSNETFWRENAYRFGDSQCKFLKQLVDLLKSSSDPVTLAVALSDLMRIVNNYEPGRRDIGRINGAKARIMELISFDDPQVKFQALMLLQVLLTHSWE